MDDITLTPEQAIELVKQKGYLTIQQSKSVRCLNIDKYGIMTCKIWHGTCRRCGIHFSTHNSWGADKEKMLCESCLIDYTYWFKQTYVDPTEKHWKELTEIEREIEQKQGIMNGYQIFAFVSRVGEFVRKCKIIDIQSSTKKLLLE